MENNKWAVEELEANMEGYTAEEKESYLNQVALHGCVSGSVSGVIYHHDNKEIFANHMDEILEAVAEYEEETGVSVLANISKEGNTEYLYTYLVWFVVEGVAHQMLNELEESA